MSKKVVLRRALKHASRCFNIKKCWNICRKFFLFCFPPREMYASVSAVFTESMRHIFVCAFSLRCFQHIHAFLPLFTAIFNFTEKISPFSFSLLFFHIFSTTFFAFTLIFFAGSIFFNFRLDFSHNYYTNEGGTYSCM